MVHSAVKRKRSSEDISASEDVSRDQSVALDQSANDISATNPPRAFEPYGIFVPLLSGPEDPRPTVLALLHFLSDTELFALVTSRLSQASPWNPPLFLTPFCIAGLHDFLLPLRPATESIPTSSSSPFTQIPSLLDENGRIRRKLTSPDTKTRAAALLVSIATLVNFLSPQELRLLIRARISSSQAPHHGVGWFLEFMQSGGDSVPRGKKDLDVRMAKRRDKNQKRQEDAKRLKAEKKPPQETTEDQRQVGTTDPKSSRPTVIPPVDVALPYDEGGLEDGELSSSEQSRLAAQVTPKPVLGKAPAIAPAAVRKKEKKKARGVRGPRKGLAHESLTVIPASAMTTIITPSQTSKPPFPGMGTPFFVEPFRPPPHHPALAGSQTSFQI